jgi:hydrogenase nickel incorporation protein HypB
MNRLWIERNIAMCDVCGCAGGLEHFHVSGDTVTASIPRHGGPHQVEVMQSLLRGNDHQASHNRAHFAKAGVLVVNLMSSPGAGKTSLLEATIRALEGHLTIAVIEGDLETENDAIRIRAAGAQAVQITTGNACHLDADMVHAALHRIDLAPIDLLFIENVGNLVCPASFDLGQDRNVVLLSVTEGDDKPQKYPVMFRAADVMLITKLDLLEAVGDFEPGKASRHLRELASAAPVLALSARNGEGFAAWIDWLITEAASRAKAAHSQAHCG